MAEGRRIILELEDDGGVTVDFEGLSTEQVAWMLKVAEVDLSMCMIDSFKTKMGFKLEPDTKEETDGLLHELQS